MKKLQIDNLKGQLARTLADYDNLRKRTEEEKITWIKFSGERILIKLLPILDSLESANKHLKDQGLAIAVSEFKNIFKEEGLKEILPKPGDEFDANIHEVIEVISGKDNNKVAEVVLPGWKFESGRVLRHAKVKVFQKSS